jgi:hypothetical protein
MSQNRFTGATVGIARGRQKMKKVKSLTVIVYFMLAKSDICRLELMKLDKLEELEEFGDFMKSAKFHVYGSLGFGSTGCPYIAFSIGKRSSR